MRFRREISFEAGDLHNNPIGTFKIDQHATGKSMPSVKLWISSMITRNGFARFFLRNEARFIFESMSEPRT
jgi:hypothetical protein